MTPDAAVPGIGPERYAERLSRTQAILAERGIAALLVGVGADLRWLIGYAAMPLERLTLLVLPPAGRAALVVPRLELAAARASTGVGADLVDVVTWEETDDPVDLAVRQAGVQAAATRGPVLVSDRLAAAFLLPIQARLPRTSFALGSTVLSELRAIKDADEIELLRLAAHAADRTVAAIAAGRLVGRTEADVAREVRARLVDEGHDGAAFSVVASGPNSASPHHDASGRIIREGEPIVLDIGGVLRGYGSDITRTLWVTGGTGEGPDDEFSRLFAVLEEAHSKACTTARAGVACEDVDRAARDHISAHGFGDAFIHRTGHGIGLEGHEDPYLVAGNDRPLRPGHAFSVEPGIYLDGRYGARIEDIVVCRPDGPDVLNETPRGLAVVSGV